MNPITSSLCLFRQKQLCSRSVSLILINSLGKCEWERQIRTCHTSVRDVCTCVCMCVFYACTQACLWECQNDWVIGIVKERESIKAFFFYNSILLKKKILFPTTLLDFLISQKLKVTFGSDCDLEFYLWVRHSGKVCNRQHLYKIIMTDNIVYSNVCFLDLEGLACSLTTWQMFSYALA